jgi:hypothetical protein
VSIEPVDSLSQKIIKRYNKQPVGWNILRDFKGNILIIGPKKGYMLKLVTINPQEYTGVGMQIKNQRHLQKLVKGAPLYGYRPLPNTKAKQLINSFSNTKKQYNIISELLEKNPISTLEIEQKKPSLILNGPILSHPDLSTISKSQRKLDLKLKIEVQKLFKKKYPHRAEMYR